MSRIVWEYVETYQDDEPITCPACDTPIKSRAEAAIVMFTCECGQELQIHNKRYHVHEVYAKKEVADARNKTKTKTGTEEVSPTEHA